VSLPPNHSPYAPPASGLDAPRAAPATEQLATTGQRLANYLLDQVAATVLGSVVGFAFGALVGDPGTAQSIGIGILLDLVYFTSLEFTSGRTFGKLVTGTRVVSEDGTEPSFAQILGRTFARLIPFEMFSFLVGAGHPVGWHDSLSRTRVIRIR
jgi:uncharacterized RDD family membrane protein YckC